MKKNNVITLFPNKIIVPHNRTFEVLDEILLSEEIEHFHDMNASEVDQELEYYNFGRTPSNDFLKAIENLNTNSIQPSICLENEKRILLNNIDKWLGKEYSLNKVPFINDEILFKFVDSAYKSIFYYYKLNPLTSRVSDLIDGKLNTFKETKDNTYLCGISYIDMVVEKSLIKLKREYPEISNVNKEFIIAWLKEIARIPIRKEIIQTVTHFLVTGESLVTNPNLKNIEPESILYMILLFLHSQDKGVLYCNYLKKTPFGKLHVYSSNGEGNFYHFYKQEIAYKCMALLEPDKYINKAFLIDISKSKIVLPFLLFCIRTKEQQIILIGKRLEPYQKDKNEIIGLLIEALELSGFEVGNASITLEQEETRLKKIAFKNAHFTSSNKLKHIKTTYIKKLVKQNKLTDSCINSKYMKDMVNAMKTTVKEDHAQSKKMNGTINY